MSDHNLVPYAASLLTPRETEILRLVLLGKDNSEFIAAELSACTGNRESASAQYPEEIAESEQAGVDTGLLGQ